MSGQLKFDGMKVASPLELGPYTILVTRPHTKLHLSKSFALELLHSHTNKYTDWQMVKLLTDLLNNLIHIYNSDNKTI